MTVEHLYPFAGDHAVQTAAIALEWQGDLSDQTLLRIYSLADKLKPFFDKVDLQKMMMINIGDAGASTNHTDGLGAVVFQKATPLGTVAKHLMVSRNNCTFIVNDYSRWAVMLEDAKRNFSVILPVILADKAISAIGLQYTDSFTWKEDPDNLEMANIFRKESPFIPSNAMALKTLWHNHHGYLESSTKPVPHTLLNNVNVTVQDVSGERNIQIATSHRASLNKPLRLSTESYLDVFTSVENHMHIANKALLGKLLTDDVAAKIKLNA
ncbi:hypothetical protein [Duganella sp. HH101]|uniref:hypothetical protein n=1 Tax=Duganella sp. HH101 TaxID=1781066 RepID=UPI0008940B74|nr:hypothetical protein [Duganella sp. HH101]OFA06366.1 hypothetical protein DUGA2_09060 [Duganella sp. HH101]